MSLPENGNFISSAVNHPYSGVISKKGPTNPYRVVGKEAKDLAIKREITSKLGFIVERSALKILSGEIPQQPDNDLLKSALRSVRKRLSPLKEKTIKTDAEISTHYQALTEPPDIPFLGDERTWPSYEPLKILFEETDKVFNTSFLDKFSSLGSFLNKVNPEIRYYVEAAETLSSLLTEELYTTKGHVTRSVWFVENRARVQFDGIITPHDRAYDNKNDRFADFLQQNVPWGVIQVKTNFRARYLSGKNKLKHPFPRDIREFQNQLAICALGSEDFHFPKFVQFYYCRGTFPHAYHYIGLNKLFFTRWASVLEHNNQNGNFQEENIDDIITLLTIIYKQIDQCEEPRFSKPLITTNGYAQKKLSGF